ncbi:MAG: transcription-repair coupling factor [Zetaproteobacteria bacterium CG12_big_fil_rev_8_21_14_0_65_54_13]|nr:MAG: transcription-repair coupling factor [Zetaproteobacteria bacterium CG23_combo_of_CG06-09_8_20_14_all_54_7]PIW45295.1 MAG: transcription-repair coupling factor [Zetaproteobacteria bacterium CG12_big_fil_rev_8_21_14_0_65_54_13]PIX54160.1 MAG: transcription-repair coupling factor [Zetaproteobacteria bacterium CG_4_10_14_3_um_filter_54_28]PJA29805.1 MAG: transcription-repair coupling factor [Zetaproteobacteria bacterium CG_4_9_14_3_um_filter_54_145]
MQSTPNSSDLSSLTGLAWQLAELARTDRFSVWICPDLRAYRQLVEEVAFFLSDQPQRLWRMPAWEVLPYDRVSPHHGLVGERFATLARLLNTPNPTGLLLTALPAWLQRIAPPEVVAAHVWQIKPGDMLDIATLKLRLAEAGMSPAERVLAAGEFAARGGLFDVWPATEETPLRIDMFGDEIESIRRFDPETQRSGESLPAFTSVPVREVILDQHGRDSFTAAFRARFPHLRTHPMLTSVQAGRPHPGIEALLPLAYESTARLNDYLPADAEIYTVSNINSRREAFAEQVRGQFDMVRASSEPSISPQELYAVESAIKPRAPRSVTVIQPAPSLVDFATEKQPLHALRDALTEKLTQGWQIELVAHGLGQQERMLEACMELSDAFAGAITSCIGYLDTGFVLPQTKRMLLTGRELLGQRLPRKRRSGRTVLHADIFTSLAELKPGDPVVHEDHGVGRYHGLETIDEDGDLADFIKIEYADKAHVFVPVEELARLHRYTGEDAPKLNKLGSEKWKRTRERVKTDLLAMAHELIELEAERTSAIRPPCLLQGALQDAYEEFAARFPFEETDDQAQAIDAVLADLARDKPMDRVVCGDVGFGKTEVAMRAAFIVAESGRQVAILAPTTVLANQHFTSFSERFIGSNLKVALISRLQGKKEAERITRELAGGEIRIIVGTHRLLSDNFAFADLGMVIVDEEQRFGVKHKQKLKSLHASVDLLTLTATPIPRTLHQTLSGLRSVSIISTPPAEREAIRTMVSSFDRHIAAEAIRRELYRGGQVYYLHNHVQSIERITARLREDVPEAAIGIAHGQMTPAELDRQMLAFYEGRLHVLVCTTIIESGLDVANANTLIVERADLLGLSQLHQIRGRVGRSHRQAYAYLFTPDARAMTADARERLQAIAEHSELGAGFLLARQDMEIRGAGNLLGAEQSGRIDEIGLDMYLDMLSDAVAEARGKAPRPKQPLDMHLGNNAILPPDYMPQPGERLSLYRRIARADDDAQITLLFEEMTDRFGRMPDEAKYCLENARIRWRAQALALSAIRADNLGLRLSFTADSPIEPAALFSRVQREPHLFRLTPDGNLTLLHGSENQRERLKACIAFLDSLLESTTS